MLGITDLINKLSKDQTDLKSEMSLRSYNLPKGKAERQNERDKILTLMLNFKVFYAKLYHTARKVFNNIEKPLDLFRSLLQFNTQILPPMEIQAFPDFLSNFDESSLLIPLDRADLIDIFTFSIIPSNFHYFILENENLKFITFMEKVYRSSPDRFYLYARSAFLSPLFITLIEKSFGKNLKDVDQRRHDLDGVISYIFNSFQENINLCPLYIKQLIEIPNSEDEKKKLLDVCLFDILEKEPRLFGVGYYYKKQPLDVLSDVWKLIKEKNNFCEQITANDSTYLYSFQIIDQIFEHVSCALFVDTFDDIFYRCYISDKKEFSPKVPKFDANTYGVRRIVLREPQEIRQAEDRTMAQLDLDMMNIRYILKFAPNIPTFDKRSEEMFPRPFNLVAFFRSLVMRSDHQHIVPMMQKLVQLDRDMYTNIDLPEVIESHIRNFDLLYVSYDEAKKLRSRIRKITQKRKLIRTQTFDAISQLSSLSFAVFCENELLEAIEAGYARKNIDPSFFIMNPQEFAAVVKSFVEAHVPWFMDNSQEFKIYIAHLFFNNITFNDFKSKRNYLALDNQTYDFFLKNRDSLLDQATRDLKPRDKEVIQSLISENKLQPFFAELEEVYSSNDDPLQKHLNTFSWFLRYCSYLMIYHYEIDSDNSHQNILIIYTLAKIKNLVTNHIYITEFLSYQYPGYFTTDIIDGLLQTEGLKINIHRKLVNDSEKVTFYLCGSDESLAVKFMQSVNAQGNEFNRKIYCGNMCFVMCHIVRVESPKALEDLTKDKQIDEKYILNFGVTSSETKSGLNAAKDFREHTVIYYEKSEKAEKILKSPFFRTSGWTFEPIEQSFIEILTKRVKDLDLSFKSFNLADYLKLMTYIDKTFIQA